MCIRDIYLALISVRENDDTDLTGKNIGLFSYGSGATGEFFDLRVQPGYAEHLFPEQHQSLLQDRDAIDYDGYITLWHEKDLTQGTQECASGRFRLTGIEDDKRIYVDQQA